MISKNNILDLEVRRNIYQVISKNPGLHFREISRKMNIPKTTLDYHINFLLKSNILSVKDDGNYKRFFISGKVGSKDKVILGFLRQEVPFKILISFLFPGFCSEMEISKDLKLAYSTVHFHITKLIENEIIRPAEGKDGRFISALDHKPYVIKQSVGREKFYTFKDQKTLEDIKRILITHKKNLLDPKLIYVYNEFNKEWDKVYEIKNFKKFFGFKKTIDNFMENLEDIFFFPYQF